MKSGLKSLVDDYIENALAASELIKMMLKGVSAIATESKKMADFMILMNKRIDQHEKVLLALTKASDERFSKADAETLALFSNKTTQKPN